MVSFKLEYKSTIRRVSVENNVNLDGLNQLAKELFQDQLPSEFNFQYKDEEDDLVTISSDRELEEAFKFFAPQRPVRLLIIGSKGKNPSDVILDTLDIFAKQAEKELENTYKFLAPHVNHLHQQVKKLLEMGEKSIESVRRSTAPATAPKPTKPNPTPAPQAVHFHITCDGCNQKPLLGPRFKCLDCPDYDLCLRCKETAGPHQHPSHKFSRIERPIIPHFARMVHCPKRIHALVQQAYNVAPTTTDSNNNNSTSDNNSNTTSSNEKSTETNGQGPVITPLIKLNIPKPVVDNNNSDKEKKEEQQPQANITPLIPLVMKPRTSPLIPLNFVAKKQEEKKEEATIPVDEKPVTAEDDATKASGATVDIPTPSEPQQEEQQQPEQRQEESTPSNIEATPFQLKLNQLQEMGFPNTRRNIELLVKHSGDLVLAIKDLLEEL
jgi:hypothetical protein